MGSGVRVGSGRSAPPSAPASLLLGLPFQWAFGPDGHQAGKQQSDHCFLHPPRRLGTRLKGAKRADADTRQCPGVTSARCSALPAGHWTPRLPSTACSCRSRGSRRAPFRRPSSSRPSRHLLLFPFHCRGKRGGEGRTPEWDVMPRPVRLAAERLIRSDPGTADKGCPRSPGGEGAGS